ncbi:hypothetical protein HN873_039463, partial [Arachis hypogaea]
MSDPQRKGKGKATTDKRKRGESSMSLLELMHDDSWWEKHFTPQEKANQLLPANDPIKFANRYCELKYPVFATSRNLYLERTLKIPEELQQYTSDQIKQRGWFFLDRNLTEVNASWCTSEGNRYWSLKRPLRIFCAFSLSQISLT